MDRAHTVRLPLPDMLARGVTNVLRAPVYLSGALVAPTSATVTVYDSAGTVWVAAGVATISASIATYSIGAGVLSSAQLGEGWRVEWSITLSDGTVLTPRNDAALVRNRLWPVITDDDLFRRVPALDGSTAGSITTATGYQDYLDEAWTEIQLRLIRLGNRPNLIMEPSALRDVHLNMTLALVFEALAARSQDQYEARAAAYRQQYEAAWRELAPRYDTSDSGAADTRRAASPTIWLTSRGGGGWR